MIALRPLKIETFEAQMPFWKLCPRAPENLENEILKPLNPERFEEVLGLFGPLNLDSYRRQALWDPRLVMETGL